jgi:tRNA threonylcarbamoyladenosine biosynthesis protein TsaE
VDDIMVKTFNINNPEETIMLGEKLGNVLENGDVVLLLGDLSAGKTTFTKGIGKALGVTRIINSPTFTIVKSYKGTKGTLYHLDLYRLDGLNNDFDLYEYIETDGVCVIEWPYQVEELLPKEYILVNIIRTYSEKRTIEIKAIGDKYIKKVEAL